jgi:hypothetical protein
MSIPYLDWLNHKSSLTWTQTKSQSWLNFFLSENMCILTYVDILHLCILTMIFWGNPNVVAVVRRVADLFRHSNCEPYKHVKHFRTQMNLQIHFLYICSWIHNLLGLYEVWCPLKFEKSISLKHQFGEIRLHAWCHKMKAHSQVRGLMSRPNRQQTRGKT